MNYLQLVQKAMRKSGAKIAQPTTVVNQTGLPELFVEWVSDSWKDIQLERLGIDWRVSRNLTFNLVAGTYEYGMDPVLEDVNLRSFKANLAGENESPVRYCLYDDYITQIDYLVRQSGKPTSFTVTPDDQFLFWPNPDATYEIRYEGILEVEVLDFTDDAGVGTSDALVPRGLRTEYHDAIVWQTIINYALHFEDGSKLSEAQAKFKPYKKYFEERFMPTPTLDTSALYSNHWYAQ